MLHSPRRRSGQCESRRAFSPLRRRPCSREIGRASCRERVWIWVVAVTSRRRHTRCSRDWSSDVCSSDLRRSFDQVLFHRDLKCLHQSFADTGLTLGDAELRQCCIRLVDALDSAKVDERFLLYGVGHAHARSEERRVGKECGSGWWPSQAEDGIRDVAVTGVQTCALPIFGEALIKSFSTATSNAFTKASPILG